MTGMSWPQPNMPGAWQAIAQIFPSTFGVRGFLRISSMGGTLDDIEPEFIALWIQAVIYFFITCAVYRYQINRTRKQAYDRMAMLKSKAATAKENRMANAPKSTTPASTEANETRITEEK